MVWVSNFWSKKTILLLKNILFGRLVRFELSDKNVHLNVKLALININPCIIQIKIKWNCLAMQMTTISYRTTEKNWWISMYQGNILVNCGHTDNHKCMYVETDAEKNGMVLDFESYY